MQTNRRRLESRCQTKLWQDIAKIAKTRQGDGSSKSPRPASETPSMLRNIGEASDTKNMNLRNPRKPRHLLKRQDFAHNHLPHHRLPCPNTRRQGACTIPKVEENLDGRSPMKSHIQQHAGIPDSVPVMRALLPPHRRCICFAPQLPRSLNRVQIVIVCWRHASTWLAHG